MDQKTFQEKINSLEADSRTKLNEAQNLKAVEEMRVWLFGRQGEFNKLLKLMPELSPSDKIHFGQTLNRLKRGLEKALEARFSEIKEEDWSLRLKKEKIDVTRPAKKRVLGHLHPLTQALEKMENIFRSYGFAVIDGPEIETEYYNFDALNIPAHHPARDLQDTFWVKQPSKSRNRLLMRTQTSAVQVRFLEKNNPPLRLISPGRVFRHEATDASHDIQFYQVEGLMVDKHVNLANLIGVLEDFFKKFFNKDIQMRVRPGYFPFVEPGIEIDIKLTQNSQSSAWLEVAGAGMVHPKVLEAAGMVPGDWQGFAFGMGLDRLAMLFYGIDDIRLLYGNDLRFLRQF